MDLTVPTGMGRRMKMLKICERCKQPITVNTNYARKYCGSHLKKTGCAWIVRQEKKRIVALAKYHRDYANPEKRRIILARSAKSYTKHRDRYARHNREWRHKNKDRSNFIKIKRIGSMRANGGTHTYEQWQFVLSCFDYRCAGCNRNFIKLTEDHMVPITKGGTNWIDNIQALCQSCNSSKRQKIMFAAQRISDRTFHLVQYGNPVVLRSNVFYTQAS